jgi:hypothetical protein
MYPNPVKKLEQTHYNSQPRLSNIPPFGVSRSEYAALLQILLMLGSVDPIKALPKTLDHLKQQFWPEIEVCCL